MKNNNTNTLILICVETNNKAQTDSAYINNALKHYYDIGNDIKIKFIPMCSKTKYKDRSTIYQINTNIKQFDNYYVVYCFDTDDIETSVENITINKEIEDFCKKNKYKLVWFCRDIEEVFLHKHISDDEKVKTAKKFARDGDLSNVSVENLSSSELKREKSNILSIFDTLLKRKL